MPIMPIGIRGFTLTAQAPILSNFDLQDSQHLTIIKDMIKRFWGALRNQISQVLDFCFWWLLGLKGDSFWSLFIFSQVALNHGERHPEGWWLDNAPWKLCFKGTCTETTSGIMTTIAKNNCHWVFCPRPCRPGEVLSFLCHSWQLQIFWSRGPQWQKWRHILSEKSPQNVGSTETAPGK